jgi:3-oxoacyl-[acyl-carrier protein] reductase
VITNARNTSNTPVAIVTGGSRNMGRAVARTLAMGGYAVVIGYLNNQPAADAAIDEILAANGTAVAVRADVADERDVERLFGETIDAFGGVDVVVHAAARMNARGTVVVNQQASLHVRDGGAIVNFSSSDAVTSVLVRELRARDITVNAIALGLEHPATPADIANLVAFLVSEDGHWINGQVIWASGPRAGD